MASHRGVWCSACTAYHDLASSLCPLNHAGAKEVLAPTSEAAESAADAREAVNASTYERRFRSPRESRPWSWDGTRWQYSAPAL